MMEETARTSVKVYEPILAIDNINLDFGVSTKITCIECCGSRLFIGTLEGTLIEYFITDFTRNDQFSRVRQSVLKQGQPIIHISAASALDSLIILVGNQLSLFDIQTFEPKGKNGLARVTALAIDENPVSGDPFIVEFCFSRKTSIHLAQASAKGFAVNRDINVDSLPLSLSMESGLICTGLSNGYYYMVNTLKNVKPMQLCNFDTGDHPRVTHVNKEEFLVFGPGGLGVFVTKAGTSERPPLSWPYKVSEFLVHNHMNVVAIGEDAIFIHSLIDYNTCHTIQFSGAKCISLSEGNLYIGTSRSLYRLKPISIQQQVEDLLASDEIEKAFGLLQLSTLRFEEQVPLLKKIHRKAVFVRLANFDFESVRTSVKESSIDLREIVCLFPNILPLSSTFTRSLPPLHNFVDVTHLCKNNMERLKDVSLFTMFLIRDSESTASSKDLSSALLKLSSQFDHSKLFQQTAKNINQLNVDFDDVVEWLESRKFSSSVALLYKSTGELGKALDIWINILEGKIQSVPADEFPGVEIVIEALVESRDPMFVWKYFEKLATLEPGRSVEVFTRKLISTDFPPLQVAEKLKKWPDLCISYLEDCLRVKDIQDEDCHTFLATLYIDQILSGEPSYAETLRERLKQFLIDSNCLRHQFLIGKLSKTKLRHELAILHGKAGDHIPALLVFTKELSDHKMARDYCAKLRTTEDRKRASLDLLNIYLTSALDVPVSENIPHIMELLSNFCEEFDLTLVLPMLPDDWSVELVSNVLHRAIRTNLHKSRRAKLLSALSSRVNVDFQLEAYDENQGYTIQDESICDVCSKKFDLTDPIFCINGMVIHEKCK